MFSNKWEKRELSLIEIFSEIEDNFHEYGLKDNADDSVYCSVNSIQSDAFWVKDFEAKVKKVFQVDSRTGSWAFPGSDYSRPQGRNHQLSAWNSHTHFNYIAKFSRTNQECANYGDDSKSVASTGLHNNKDSNETTTKWSPSGKASEPPLNEAAFMLNCELAEDLPRFGILNTLLDCDNESWEYCNIHLLDSSGLLEGKNLCLNEGMPAHSISEDSLKNRHEDRSSSVHDKDMQAGKKDSKVLQPEAKQGVWDQTVLLKKFKIKRDQAQPSQSRTILHKT